MHLLNYTHPVSAVELTQMRRHHEIVLARSPAELASLTQRRDETARAIDAAKEPLDVQGLRRTLARIDDELADARKRQSEHKETIEEIDRRLAAMAPPPAA